MNFSFKYKFIFSFVLLESIFLALIIYFNINFINNSSYKLIDEKEKFIKNLSKKLLKVPVSNCDIGTIDNILKNMIEHQNVKLMKVFDSSNLLLSQVGDAQNISNSTVEKISLIQNDLKLGYLEIWLDFQKNYSIIENHKNTMYKIILLELLLSLLMAYLIGYTLSKNLEKLEIDAKKLGEDENYKIKQIFSNDEVSVLSKSMIQMQTKIKERSDKLKDLNKNLDEKIKEEIEKNKAKDKILFEQAKLASMGEMIANIAHQWRQPLSVISSSATGIIIQSDNNILTKENLEENCKYINDNVQYLSKTIDDFREYIKGEKDKVHFKVSEVISSFNELTKPVLWFNNINLKINILNDEILYNYPNEILQILLNIFNNSKDAFLEKIYEPYFTTKHKNIGTGLGLNIVYNLVKNGISGKVYSENINFTFEDEEYKGLKTVINIPLD